jgi:L-ascorbate metabolism protein UlaG (beta-lactamase superfamily)
VDAVVVSHAHHDHLDRPSLALLGPDQRIVAPMGIGPLLRRWGFHHVDQVRAGEEIRIGAVAIRATSADHRGLRLGAPGLRGGKEGPPALGYVIAGRRFAYFAGDTDLFAGMTDLAPRIDLALLPVWGWGRRLGPGHMDPMRAAMALQLLRPRVAVPIHWGTLASFWQRTVPGSPDEPALAFQRHARELAPFVDVRVLPPGGTTRF